MCKVHVHAYISAFDIFHLFFFQVRSTSGMFATYVLFDDSAFTPLSWSTKIIIYWVELCAVRYCWRVYVLLGQRNQIKHTIHYCTYISSSFLAHTSWLLNKPVDSLLSSIDQIYRVEQRQVQYEVNISNHTYIMTEKRRKTVKVPVNHLSTHQAPNTR